ncbi:MAG: hypothetical protein ABI068_03465 [Ktedonobacterales bacterium]
MARIERLAQDNQRTQGAEQRAWYRRHSPRHLREMATLIDGALAARLPAAAKTCVVLGAGACTEIPLERLARACNAVTLVDIDVQGMRRARDELPSAVRNRVDLLIADLTGGVSAALADELRSQPWADLAQLDGGTGTAALDAVASLLERLPIAAPPAFVGLAPAGYGIVLSALTLTQLYSLPLLDVLDTLLLHAPQAADRREAHPRYRAAAQTFRWRIVQAHLALLEQLVAPGGAILLTTDVTGYLLPPTAGPHAHDAREALSTLPPDVLMIPDDLTTRFDLLPPPHTWEWLVAAPDATTPGRAYDVVGRVLRRKAAANR